MENFIFLGILVIVVVGVIFYKGFKEKLEIQKKIGSDSSQLREEKQEFLRKLNRRNKILQIVSSGFILLIAAFPFCLIALEDYSLDDKWNFQPILDQMKYAVTYGGISFIICLPLVILLYKHIQKINNNLNSIILETTQDEFHEVKRLSETLNFWESFLPPIIFCGKFLYVFKPLKTLKIDLLQVKAINLCEASMRRQRGFFFGLNKITGNHFFMVAGHSYPAHLVAKSVDINPHIKIQEFSSVTKVMSETKKGLI